MKSLDVLTCCTPLAGSSLSGKALAEVRAIRDEIEARVSELVEQRLDDIRSDQSAHEFRLARLLPSLLEEFEGLRTPEQIRACADAVLADFREAPVRAFVISLARRRATECLRAETCEALLA